MTYKSLFTQNTSFLQINFSLRGSTFILHWKGRCRLLSLQVGGLPGRHSALQTGLYSEVLPQRKQRKNNKAQSKQSKTVDLIVIDQAL